MRRLTYFSGALVDKEAKEKLQRKVLERLYERSPDLQPKDTSDSILKNALILISGVHKDNKGKIHEFSHERLKAIARNTNVRLDSGGDVPIMIEHSRTLFSNGDFAKLGYLVGKVECRVIGREDLPNPKHEHLLGQMGLFGKAAILHHADKVRKGLIKNISAGLDLTTDCLYEVSAVENPAISGAALFQEGEDSDIYGLVKKEYDLQLSLKTKVLDCVEILFRAIQTINATPQADLEMSLDAAKNSAIDHFAADVRAVLGISVTVEGLESSYSKFEEEDSQEETSSSANGHPMSRKEPPPPSPHGTVPSRPEGNLQRDSVILKVRKTRGQTR